MFMQRQQTSTAAALPHRKLFHTASSNSVSQLAFCFGFCQGHDCCTPPVVQWASLNWRKAPGTCCLCMLRMLLRARAARSVPGCPPRGHALLEVLVEVASTGRGRREAPSHALRGLAGHL